MLYHNLIINLHELVTAHADALSTDSRWEGSRSALAHSKLCFETLIRLYFLRHGYESADVYLTHPLAVMAFMSLQKLGAATSPMDEAATCTSELDDVRSTLFLTAKGLSDQAENFHIPYTVLQAIQHNMSPQDLNTLATFLNFKTEDRGTAYSRTKHVQTQYPVNIVNITDHPDQRRLGNIIQEFSEMALEASATSSDTGSSEQIEITD